MNLHSLANRIAETHDEFRLRELNYDNCRQSTVSVALRKMLSGRGNMVRLEREGTSIEGRPIPLLRYGSGPIRILLWSQMHGDEPTATLALMDILRFLNSGKAGIRAAETIAQHCTVYAIPVLNPDGASRRSRHTAMLIDMNRDARRLSTPEARFLRQCQRRIRPGFGFNLHDQELSTVGTSQEIAAIALLAPAADWHARKTPVRRRAIQVAATLAKLLAPFAPGRIATYDEAHEPRAFGDLMQAWGTSTVLIESGHAIGDPAKEGIRRLNYIGILTALSAIADGSFRRTPPAHYTRLRPNGKRAYDIIVRNVTVMNRDGLHVRSDVGIRTTRVGGANGRIQARICEVGDLNGFSALIEVRGRRRPVLLSGLTIEKNVPLPGLAEKLGFRLPAVRS